MCDDDEEGFGLELNKVHAKIKTKYNCPLERCTNLEIGVKQWAFSMVSENPIDEIYTPSKSMNSISQIF